MSSHPLKVPERDRAMRVLLVGLLVVGCAGTGEHGTLDTIPKPAAEALRVEAGGVAIEKVERELEGGVELWEATWVANGRRHEAKVSAAGVLVEYEVEVPAAEVPPAVRATAVRELGVGARYERLMDGTYEAEIVVAGKEREVVIGVDGQLVGREPDDDDAED